MNKWMAKLKKMDGMVLERKDVYGNILQSPSPSVNNLFGRTQGLPKGYTAVFYGPPKGGKLVLSHFFIGQLHQTDPEALAIKIDTEFRADGQLDDESMAMFGIDPERIGILQANAPGKVFDQIERDIATQCESGSPVKLIVIDSINGVQGLRDMNNDSIENVTIGDHAKTVQHGLKRILPVIRKYDIGVILIDQVRAEMDPIKQKKGKKFRMQCSFGAQHGIEYFVQVQENDNADCKQDMYGKYLTVDGDPKSQRIASKIKVIMADSTMSGETKNRKAQFTFHFRKGIINQHEEVFELGKLWGIITSEKQGYYTIDGLSIHGEANALRALADSPAVQASITKEVMRRDLAGEYSGVAVSDEAEDEE